MPLKRLSYRGTHMLLKRNISRHMLLKRYISRHMLLKRK
jgi:hypothetical protein